MYGSFNSIVSDYSQELCRACAILIEREAAQSNVERGRNSVVPTDEYDGASRRPSIINAEPFLIANAAIIETLAPIEQSVDTFNPGETVQALAALSPAKRARAAMALERKYANAAKAYPTICSRPQACHRPRSEAHQGARLGRFPCQAPRQAGATCSRLARLALPRRCRRLRLGRLRL